MININNKLVFIQTGWFFQASHVLANSQQKADNNHWTRFDFWDDKKCLINLERMNNIFEYVNNYSFGMIISIDANDEIENKVRLIYKKIYG